MLKNLAIVAVFCVAVQASAPVIGQTPNRSATTSKNPKHAADSDQKPTEATPSPQPQQSDSPTLKPDPGQKKPGDAKQPVTIPEGVTVRIAKDGTDWGVVANLILAAVGIGGIVAAICTLIKLERQTKATEDTAEISRLAMISGNRAFIFFDRGSWTSYPLENGGVFWRLRSLWSNVGNTPTRGFVHQIQYELRDSALPEDFQFRFAEEAKSPPLVISPKGQIGMPPFDISGEDMAAVAKQEKFLYLWGVAKYRDVFPETAKHITKFCSRIVVMGGEPLRVWHDRDNKVELFFIFHHAHNCTDEDCAEQKAN
jgi:hypothetical protein